MPLPLLPADVPLTPDPDQARQWLIDELSQQVYQDARPSWLQQVIAGIVKWLGDLFSHLGAIEPNLGAALFAVGAGIAIGLCIWLIRPRVGVRGSGRKRGIFDDETAVLDAGAYRRRAEQHAAGANWADAYLDRFRAIVRAAEERTILTPAPGRTAEEAAALLRQSYPLQDGDLAHAARTFDAILFGGARAGQTDYGSVSNLDDTLTAARPADSSGTPSPVIARPL